MMGNLRYEVKMVMDAFQLGQVRSWVYTHSNAFHVSFPPRQVNNIYFDTFDHQFMLDHIDGVAERGKYRYRWYGNTWQLEGGQLEIKKKMAKLGQKDLFPFSGSIDLSHCSWRELYLALRRGFKECTPGTIDLLELLLPTLINHYQREYYLSMDGVVRLTLDYDMVAYEQRFGLKPNLNYPQPARSNLVIEIKGAKDEHRRIADTLSEFPQRCSQNSKYLNGLEYSAW